MDDAKIKVKIECPDGTSDEFKCDSFIYSAALDQEAISASILNSDISAIASMIVSFEETIKSIKSRVPDGKMYLEAAIEAARKIAKEIKENESESE